ncbi:MAG: type pilus assembly protein PilM [Solirubrobacteraceae bacterium]|nr:type pilus assembly protein PilM [Solirubrobacteraceae bacterium]
MGRKKPSNFVGLSIEPGLIAAAQVSVNGSVVIEDGGRAELEAGVVRDGDVADSEALAAALRDLWREHKDLDRRVRIGIANARIVMRTLYLPPITNPKELSAAVRFQAVEAIPMPLADAVLDFHALGIEEGPDGPRQRIVLVAARRDMIMAVLSAARAAGLKPAGIDLAAFGMVRVLQRQRRAGDSPELFVAVGGLTNLAISDRGVCVFTRVAGGGLESLAAELAERREITAAQARAWIHLVGLEVDVADLDADPSLAAEARAILTAGVRRIATEIRASLDFHEGQASDHVGVGRVVLTGPAVAVAGFSAALSAELDLEVEERVVGSAAAMHLSRLDSGSLSIAAGLAIESALPS